MLDDDDSNDAENKPEIKTETKRVKIEENTILKGTNDAEISKIEIKVETIIEDSEQHEDRLLTECLSQMDNKDLKLPSSQTDFDYYLNNFTTAIQSVLNQETFSLLFDQTDYDVIKRFSLLSSITFTTWERHFK